MRYGVRRFYRTKDAYYYCKIVNIVYSKGF